MAESIKDFPKPKARVVRDLKDINDHYTFVPLDPEAREDLEDPIDIQEFDTVRQWLQTTTKIVKLKLVSRFMDDHELCFDAIVTNQIGEPVGVSFWWCGHITEDKEWGEGDCFAKTLRKASKGNEQSRNEVLEYMNDWMDN